MKQLKIFASPGAQRPVDRQRHPAHHRISGHIGTNRAALDCKIANLHGIDTDERAENPLLIDEDADPKPQA